MTTSATTQPEAAPAPPPAEPRQRWRITFARAADPDRLPHRDVAAAWLERLAEAGLPLAGGGRGRQPLSFGAALPAGIAAERELADVVLVDRWRIDAVRAAIETSLPAGVTVLDLHDVWLGEPPLAAAVGAADYRANVTGADPSELAGAARALLEASVVERARARGSGSAMVDIRPLVVDLGLRTETPPTLAIRCLIHPERGSGRPDEVVDALAERLARPLVIDELVRERVLLTDELATTTLATREVPAGL